VQTKIAVAVKWAAQVAFPLVGQLPSHLATAPVVQLTVELHYVMQLIRALLAANVNCSKDLITIRPGQVSRSYV
jgi:hypothetical protein